jgi:hypothetical protein
MTHPICMNFMNYMEVVNNRSLGFLKNTLSTVFNSFFSLLKLQYCENSWIILRHCSKLYMQWSWTMSRLRFVKKRQWPFSRYYCGVLYGRLRKTTYSWIRIAKMKSWKSRSCAQYVREHQGTYFTEFFKCGTEMSWILRYVLHGSP